MADEPSPVARNGGSRPVPDPTTLTDKAIERLEKSLTSYIDGEIKHLAALLDGEINLTEERFTSSERLRIEQKRDTKDAVDAALAAAKEAVKEQTEASERSIDKSEKTTEKTIGGLSEKVDDLKDRVGRMESSKLGATENRTGMYATVGIVISLILAGMAVITFALTRLS